MKTAGSILWHTRNAALIALVAIIGCKEKTPVGVLGVYETPAWAGTPGLLIAKTEAPDSDVLLIRSRDPAVGLAELFGEIPVEHDFDAGEVIYRYNPNVTSKELEAVTLRDWLAATGPEWWEVQQNRRVPSRMKIGLITGELSFGRHPVPMKGPVTVHMVQSMHAGSNKVAIISAKREAATYNDMKTGTEPGLKDFYHQVFDTKALAPVGVPIPLPFEAGDAPIGVWAGRDSYMVYTDVNRRKVCIVHMFRMPPGDQGE
jgi:hypothetical protein